MAEFVPAVTLDLKIATNKTLETALDEFAQFSKTATKLPLNLGDGWHTIEQPKAEQLLLRNPPGANRKVKLPSLRYYGEQMAIGDWQKTGQALLITDRDILVDGQHRLFACYFTGRPFTTYVITNVPYFDNIFAYIDAGTIRTNTDALMTAGLNGQSSLISQALTLNHKYQSGALRLKGGRGPNAGPGLIKISPSDVIRAAAAHPALIEAAHLQISEYKAATQIIKFKDVAVFVAWQIVENHSVDLLDEFMTALYEGGIPMFSSLRKMFEDDVNSDQPMTKAGRLAYLIKIFNAWFTKQTPKRITVRIDENFPRFMGKDAVAATADTDAA